MAATERPAPAERMAVLEAMLLPGSESRMEVAALFGSFWGTPLSRRGVEVAKVVMAGRALRIGRVGRARAAPVERQPEAQWCLTYMESDETYSMRLLPIATPL